MGPFLQNLEKWAYSLRKIPKNGYLFLPNDPLKMGMGFDHEARVELFHPNQIWVSPGLQPWLRHHWRYMGSQ